MKSKKNILRTVRMLHEENLDVRTVTMGINILSCADRNIHKTMKLLKQLINTKASQLVSVCDDLTAKYGLPIVNKRIAVSPVSQLLEGHDSSAALAIAAALDESAKKTKVDFIGGFTALVHKGITQGEEILIKSLPKVLSQTSKVCSSINIADTRSGINVDAVILMGKILCEIARATAEKKGFGAAKLVIFTNIPEDNPFMAGAYLGSGEPDCVINVGVSGPGVVKKAIDRLTKLVPNCTLDDIAEEIKHTAFCVTRTGELIGREVANRLGISFGAVDLSLAPTPRVGDSVGEIYQALGIKKIGAPGTTAAVALVNDAVKKGGAFASSSVGGLSGAFIPVMEDHAIAQAVKQGTLSIEKLEAMTAVCSVGLDMILIPGDTRPEIISGLILDEASIGVMNKKTTALRLIPVPGGKPGDFVDFGGLFGSGTIIRINCSEGNEAFIKRGGRIPASMTSLIN